MEQQGWWLALVVQLECSSMVVGRGLLGCVTVVLLEVQNQAGADDAAVVMSSVAVTGSCTVVGLMP
jgi:hypothetical protein